MEPFLYCVYFLKYTNAMFIAETMYKTESVICFTQNSKLYDIYGGLYYIYFPNNV